jgi:transcriptional regulator with XRE-family HTH domain
MDLHTPFADELKRARLAAGLSQADLGDKAGLTGSYVCMLELGRKPAPSADVVGALARALGVDEARLQEIAALERTPEPVRKRVLRLVRERGRVRRSRDALIATTIFHMTRRPGFLPDLVADALGLPDDHRLILGRLAGRVGKVKSAAEAASRSGEILGEVPARDRDALVRVLPSMLTSSVPAATPRPAEAPVEAPEPRPWRAVPVLAEPPREGVASPAAAQDLVHVDRRLWAPGAYLLVGDDDEAYPRVERGDLLLVHPEASAQDGDLVVVREGGKARVRTMRRRGDEVRLESPRADVPPIRVPASRFRPLGVVAWTMRPLRGMPAPRASHRAPAATDESEAG